MKALSSFSRPLTSWCLALALLLAISSGFAHAHQHDDEGRGDVVAVSEECVLCALLSQTLKSFHPAPELSFSEKALAYQVIELPDATRSLASEHSPLLARAPPANY